VTSQDQLVADVLGDFVPIGDVPSDFAKAVTEHIAARPSPGAPAVFPETTLRDVVDKLDEILTLLRGVATE